MLIQVGVITGILKFKRFFYITFLLNQRQRCITHIILIVLIFLYFLAVLIKLGGVIGILKFECYFKVLFYAQTTVNKYGIT